jgi:hypothetical protein
MTFIDWIVLLLLLIDICMWFKEGVDEKKYKHKIEQSINDCNNQIGELQLELDKFKKDTETTNKQTKYIVDAFGRESEKFKLVLYKEIDRTNDIQKRFTEMYPEKKWPDVPETVEQFFKKQSAAYDISKKLVDDYKVEDATQKIADDINEDDYKNYFLNGLATKANGPMTEDDMPKYHYTDYNKLYEVYAKEHPVRFRRKHYKFRKGEF